MADGLPALAIVVVLGVAATGLGWGWDRWHGGPPAICGAMRAHPAGIDVVDWSNGITSGEATWGAILAFDVFEADDDSARRIADAVRADQAGYTRLRAAADPEVRGALDRRRALATDPAEVDRRRDDPEVDRDTRAIARQYQPCPGML